MPLSCVSETAKQPFLRAQLLQQPWVWASCYQWPSRSHVSLQSHQPPGWKFPGVSKVSGPLSHQPSQGAPGTHWLLSCLSQKECRSVVPSLGLQGLFTQVCREVAKQKKPHLCNMQFFFLFFSFILSLYRPLNCFKKRGGKSPLVNLLLTCSVILSNR